MKKEIPMVKTDQSVRMQPPLSRVYGNRHPPTVSVSALPQTIPTVFCYCPVAETVFHCWRQHTVLVPVEQKGTRVSVSPTRNHRRHVGPLRGSMWLLVRRGAKRQDRLLSKFALRENVKFARLQSYLQKVFWWKFRETVFFN